jgi:1-acyl-sn-glycerol-3-phosphate acyltransferase
MRTIITLLYLAIFLICSLPIMGIIALLHLIWPQRSDRMALRVVQHAFFVIEFLSGVDLTITGQENVPQDTSVLYIGNHLGFFDIVLTYSRVPANTGYISKQSVFKVPILRLWMYRLHCLGLDRSDIRQGMKVILKAIDYVKNGTSIFIFPEGTRSKTGEVLPFKAGSFKIATKSGCPIIPVAITGTDNILENHFPWIKRAKVSITYGKPIPTASLTSEEQKALPQTVRNEIIRLKEEQHNA